MFVNGFPHCVGSYNNVSLSRDDPFITSCFTFDLRLKITTAVKEPTPLPPILFSWLRPEMIEGITRTGLSGGETLSRARARKRHTGFVVRFCRFVRRGARSREFCSWASKTDRRGDWGWYLLFGVSCVCWRGAV